MHQLTRNRQITLPQTVCNAMALQPGDYVEVFARNGMAYIVKMKSGSLAGKFHELTKDKIFPTAEELDAALRNRAARKFLGDDGD